jgi:hypothetical protein
VELLAAYSHSTQPLTCSFATPQRSPVVREPRDRAHRPWSLRERLTERDIANLITAYRNGATAASLATTQTLSLRSVKRLLRTAGVRRTAPTQQTTKVTPPTTHP